MSDFLERLAARSLGLAPTLQARTPGLFGHTEEPDPFDVDAAEPVASAPPARPTPAAAPTPLLPRQSDRPAGATTPATASAEAPADALPVASAPVAQPATPSGTPSVAATSSPRGDDVVRAADPGGTIGPVPAAAPPAADDHASTPPRRVPAPEAAIEPLLPRRRQVNAVSVAVPAAPSAEPAPTIVVSIGRVEVRAVTPPARRPDRLRGGQPEPAHLSLSEYLRQRSGNGAVR